MDVSEPLHLKNSLLSVRLALLSFIAIIVIAVINCWIMIAVISMRQLIYFSSEL
jgi:hypothetical protein